MSIASGGIVSGLLSGWRLGNEDAQRKDEFERNKQRQASEDEYRNERRQAEREDRAHTLERRPVIEGREDRQFETSMENAGLQTAINKFKVDRLPRDAEQSDAAFELDMQGKKQSIAERGQRMGMAADSHERQAKIADMQLKLAEIGYNDKVLQTEITNHQRAMAGAIAKYQAGGKLSDLQDAFNENVGNATGQRIEELSRDGNGAISIKMDGGRSIKVKDEDQLFNLAANALNPDNYIQNLYASMQGGADKNEPASVKEANAIFKRLAPQEGEDDSARWMRAYAMRSQKRGEDANQAVASFYETVMKNAPPMGDQNEAQQKALEATKQFASMFYPDYQFGQQGNSAPQGQASPMGQGEPSGAPAAPSGMPSAPSMPPGARQARDGNWYVPDPQRPGKYLRIQ